MSLGSNIKKYREAIGLSQIELANIIGVSNKAVSTWENDIKIPRMGSIQKMADYFGVLKSELIEDRKPSSSSTITTQLTAHEKEVIEAYINQPDMQHAVNVLLGIESKQETVTVLRAARSKGDEISVGETELTKTTLENLKKSSEKCPF